MLQPEMNQQFNVPKGASLLLEFNLVIFLSYFCQVSIGYQGLCLSAILSITKSAYIYWRNLSGCSRPRSSWLPFLFPATWPWIQYLCWQYQGSDVHFLVFVSDPMLCYVLSRGWKNLKFDFWKLSLLRSSTSNNMGSTMGWVAPKNCIKIDRNWLFMFRPRSCILLLEKTRSLIIG